MITILIYPKSLFPCQTETLSDILHILHYFYLFVTDNCHFWSNQSKLMSYKLRNLPLSVAIQFWNDTWGNSQALLAMVRLLLCICDTALQSWMKYNFNVYCSHLWGLICTRACMKGFAALWIHSTAVQHSHISLILRWNLSTINCKMVHWILIYLE